MKRELELLRVKMKETGVDACLIPTSDFHGSEYVGDYFKCREYTVSYTHLDVYKRQVQEESRQAN